MPDPKPPRLNLTAPECAALARDGTVKVVRSVCRENSTALGQTDAALWARLIWDDQAYVDTSYSSAGWEYLHVAACHPEDRASYKRSDGFYRVRSRINADAVRYRPRYDDVAALEAVRVVKVAAAVPWGWEYEVRR